MQRPVFQILMPDKVSINSRGSIPEISAWAGIKSEVSATAAATLDAPPSSASRIGKTKSRIRAGEERGSAAKNARGAFP